MTQPKIVAFAGSLRAGSLNKQLIRLAVEDARAAGASVTLVDLRELALPLFDQDFETASGLPEAAKRFKGLLRDSDGFLITGALKNAIDWASRTESDDEPPLVAFRGKAAALCSASPGALGGLRGLVHLRVILGNIGVIVLPDQVTIPTAHEAFDESGKLKDERKAKQVAKLARGIVEFLAKLRA